MSSDSLAHEVLEQRLREACRKLEQRLRDGDRQVAEKILADNAEFAENDEFALELIYAEFAALDELGEPPDPEELYRRFPRWRGRIERLLRVHEVLGADDLDGKGHPLMAPDTSVKSGSTLDSAAGGTPETVQEELPRVGPHELLEEIGRGAMGVVFKARQVELDRIVALKVVRSFDGGRQQRADFRREAESAARLQHPNIVQVYQVGQQDGYSYLSMEYVGDGCLVERLDGKPMPECDAAKLLEKLARAMHFAHGRGVVHRDLKPANVLLARSDSADAVRTGASADETERFEPKITDFGLAKRFWEGEWQKTRTGAILGTPGYMAPEQAIGKTRDVGPAADIYALGAILYELMTGRPPFQAPTLLETLEQVRSQDPVPPTRLRPTLSRDLETICLKCLQKEPGARYASAEALADDLRRFLAAEPIQARPIGPLERAAKWARRRPAVTALLTGIVTVALVGLAAVLWQWSRAERRGDALEAALAELGEARRAEKTQREKVEASLYFHRVALAQREWLGGHPLRAAELLKHCKSDPYRGWEWQHLNRLFHSELLTLQGHSLPVQNVIYSPDGRLLASASGTWGSDDHGEVIIWDAATGERRFTLRGHPGPIMGLAFSPDGRRLASCGGSWSEPDTSRVNLWDTATGRQVRSLNPEAGHVHSVAFSPDGRRIAVGANPDVQLWDTQTGSVCWSSQDHEGMVFEVAFSPDGRFLASAGFDRNVRVWDPETGKTLHVLRGESTMRCLAFSPDGRFAAAGTWDMIVRVWSVNAGFRQLAIYRVQAGPILDIKFSLDCRQVALVSTDGVVRLWDAQASRELLVLRGHNGQSYGVDFHPNGRVLASAGQDRTVRLWDLTAEPEPAEFLGHNARVAAIAVAPDGNLLAAAGGLNRATYGSGDKTVRIWDFNRRQRTHVLTGHDGWLTSVAFSPDGRRVASGSEDKTVKLWDVTNSEMLLSLEGHTGVVTGVAFSPDGTRLASASGDNTVKLWDTSSGLERFTLHGHTGGVAAVAYGPDGRLIASAGEDRKAVLWDAQTGQSVAVLEGHTDGLTSVRFNPNGNVIATAGKDRQVILWEVASGEGGRWVVSHRHTLRGHTEPITGLAFSPDGARLASAGLDTFIKVWDVATGHEAISLDHDVSYPADVAFSPDGSRLLAGLGSRVWIWNAEPRPPAAEQVGGDKDAIVASHRREAEACEKSEYWFAAAFHLGRLIDVDPDQHDYFARRGKAYFQQRQWSLAEADFARAGKPDSNNRQMLYHRALLLVRKGDAGEYREFCAHLLTLDAGSESVANSIAWACALGPQSVEDYDRLVQMAERTAVGAEPAKKAMYLNTLGAVLYRAGQFEAAIDAFTESMDVRGDGGTPQDWVFSAMACHRLGRTEDAARWLDKARGWIHEASPEKSEGTAGKPPTRVEELEMDLLFREAEQLLSAPGPSADPSAPGDVE